jgi:hypothetical protein
VDPRGRVEEDDRPIFSHLRLHRLEMTLDGSDLRRENPAQASLSQGSDRVPESHERTYSITRRSRRNDTCSLG